MNLILCAWYYVGNGQLYIKLACVFPNYPTIGLFLVLDMVVM